ncbi:MAG: hypothetical protein AAF513_15820 [Pseudomonadota bacterium]
MWSSTNVARWFLCLVGCLLAPTVNAQPASADGLREAPGVEFVRAHCLLCHSANLITQNHMPRERWLEAIRYMQKRHNLWSLGAHEALILDYLEAHYGARAEGPKRRRKNLPYLARPDAEVD